MSSRGTPAGPVPRDPQSQRRRIPRRPTRTKLLGMTSPRTPLLGMTGHNGPAPGGSHGPARARRQARSPLLPRQRPAARLRLLHGEARPFGPGPARGLRHLGPPGLVAPGQLQRGPHPRDHPGHLRLPARPGHRPARSSSAWTPTRSPSRPCATRARGPGRPRGRGADPGGTAATRPPRSISHAILAYNRGRKAGLADGVVVTPSHNPPEDGGFKYNPPDGGPADTATSRRPIEDAGQRDPGRGAARGEARPPREGAPGRDHPGARLRGPVRRRTWRTSSTWTRLPGRSSASASIPWAGPSVDYWGPIAERYGSPSTS